MIIRTEVSAPKMKLMFLPASTNKGKRVRQFQENEHKSLSNHFANKFYCSDTQTADLHVFSF